MSNFDYESHRSERNQEALSSNLEAEMDSVRKADAEYKAFRKALKKYLTSANRISRKTLLEWVTLVEKQRRKRKV